MFCKLRFLSVLLCLVLCACQVEMQSNLTEEAANEMLAVLLRHGVDARKKAAGKSGFVLSVEQSEMVRALELLRENGLPRPAFESMGQVFSGQGMISTATEEQSRLAYALSEELAATFSRIDGVLTARVHVTPAGRDGAGNEITRPTTAVFLRHTPDSAVTALTPRIKELAANAVPGLEPGRVSVLLLQVRENVALPQMAEPATITLLHVGLGLAALLLAGAGLILMWLKLRKR